MPPKIWNHAGSFPWPSITFPPYSVKAIVKPELKILSSSSKEFLGISLDSLDIDSTTKPKTMKNSTTVLAFVEDPDGYKIELIERD